MLRAYRIPRSAMRYAVLVAVLTTFVVLGILWAGFMLAWWAVLTGVLVWVAGAVFVLVRCRGIGVTVTEQGIVRNRFWKSELHRWAEITELSVGPSRGITHAYGFQINPLYLATITVGRRTVALLFLDERAFGNSERLLIDELTEIGRRWEAGQAAG